MAQRLALLLLLALPACLPNTLSDDALRAKVADATEGKGGPLCGNQTVDQAEGESCDDGNTDSCDACDKCEVRTALNVNDAKSLAGLTTLGAVQFDGKENWSIETWFFVRTMPKTLPMPFLVVGVPGTKATNALAFTMGLAPVGGNAVAYCGLEKLAKSTSISPTVAPNSWHHLRCVWNAKDGDMRAALDGGALAKADNKLALKPAPGFDGSSWLLLGQMPTAAAGGLQIEPFDGLLDEVRAAVGPNVAATPLSRRYSAETPETVALYHMDPATPGRFLNDATANHLDADQITLQNTTPIKRDAVLVFAAETCDGNSARNAQCLANPKPPWCP